MTTGKNGNRVGITPNANSFGLSGRFWLGDESKNRRPLLHKMLDQAQISRRTLSRNTTWSQRIPNAFQTFPLRKFPDPIWIAAVAHEQTAFPRITFAAIRRLCGRIKQMIRAFPKLNDRSIITSEIQLRRKDWARSAVIALPRAITAKGSLCNWNSSRNFAERCIYMPGSGSNRG